MPNPYNKPIYAEIYLAIYTLHLLVVPHFWLNPDWYTLLPLWPRSLLASPHSFSCSLTSILDILKIQWQCSYLRAFAPPVPSFSAPSPHPSMWLALHVVHAPFRPPASPAALFKTLQALPSWCHHYTLLHYFSPEHLSPLDIHFSFCCLPPPLEWKSHESSSFLAHCSMPSTEKSRKHATDTPWIFVKWIIQSRNLPTKKKKKKLVIEKQ